MKTLHKITALAAAIFLLLSSFPVAEASYWKQKDPEVSEEPEYVDISSLEDYVKFADNCTETAYSEGKVFVLNCNISLDGLQFEPIPYFAGTFEGNGHSVTGLNIDRGGSRRGLFRIIAPGASIKDLNVYGKVVPTGTQVYVGGIAGICDGEISSCSFNGEVSGIENVGGIAGSLGSEGSISNCSVTGSVKGEHCVGGIAGLSDGTINCCKSSAEVNTVNVVPERETQIDVANLDLASIAVDDYLDITDLGGICGKSTGIVANSSSSGNVGYHYTGYNVGGICGTTAGYVESCVSTGKIQGRKDVGGIAGQLVPYVSLDLSEGKLDEVEKSIGALNRSIAQASKTADNNETAIAQELTKTEGYVNTLSEQLRLVLDKLDGQDEDIAQHIHIDPETGEVSYDGSESVDTEALVDAMNNLYGEYAVLMGMVNNAAGEIADSLVSVSYSISGVLDSMSDTFKNANLDIEENEISVEEGYVHNRGAVSGCINRGEIYAEAYAGGVVGNIAYEIGFDKQDLLDMSQYIVTEVKEYIFAVVRDSESYGNVECKGDFVGGVAGSMSLGAVLNSTGAGYVTSLTGGYVGGIAGRSEGTIKDSFARPVLSGDAYVGGLAGCGENILNCCVYAAFSSYGEYAGAVAGWTTGNVIDNYYVSCRPAGVDGISYTGKMFAVSYEELLKKEKLPDVFREIKVRFIGPNDIVVETLPVNFGEGITQLPEIPLDGVRYWIWDSEGLNAIYHSMDVHGDYYNPVFTLSSGEEVPRFLVEGVFYEGQKLLVADSVNDSTAGKVTVSKITVSDYNGELTVRMYEEKTGKLRVFSPDGGSKEISYSTDGRYKVFKINNGEAVSFEESLVDTSMVGAIVGITAASLITALLLVLFIKRKVLKKGQENNQDDDSEQQSEEEQEE